MLIRSSGGVLLLLGSAGGGRAGAFDFKSPRDSCPTHAALLLQAEGATTIAGCALRHTELRGMAQAVESWGSCGHPADFTVCGMACVDA